VAGDEDFDDIATAAVAQCDALERLVGPIWEDMTELDEHAGELDRTLERLVGHMCDVMASRAAEADALGPKAAQAVTRVQTGLSGLAGRTEEAVTAFEEARDSVVVALQRVAARVSAASSGLKEDAAEFDRKMQSADRSLAALANALGSGATEAVGQLKSGGEMLDEALDSLDENHQEWAEALDGLTNGAIDLAIHLVSALADVSDANATGGIEALNAAIDRHNTLLAEIAGQEEATAKVLDPAQTALNGAMERLGTALEASSGIPDQLIALDEAATEAAGTLEGMAERLLSLGGLGS
jgi:chromosome segregation ATPase